MCRGKWWDGATRRIVRDFQRFHQALVSVWPPADVRASLPTLLVLCGRDRAFAALGIPRGVGTRNPGPAPVEMYHQGAVLATGALAATNLRVAVAATLAQ